MTRRREGARNPLFELSALPGRPFQKTLSDSAQELAAVAGPLLPGASETVSIFSQRFLMIKEAEQTGEAPAQTELIIVQNWFEELKRLVPTGE